MTAGTGDGLRIEVSDLVTGYGPIQVLHGVSICVEAGSAVSIVGANGAGKSTLLRAISGLLPANQGSISIGDRRVDGLAPHQIARMGVAHVPEGRQILQNMTVRENLLLASTRKAGQAERLDQALDTFPILRQKINQPGGQLSGGQQQMLAIGRALMASPRVILLDEPTLGLSPKLTEELYELLLRIKDEWSATFVLVEQNIALAADLTETAVLLQRGRVIREENAKLLTSDKELLDAYLG